MRFISRLSFSEWHFEARYDVAAVPLSAFTIALIVVVIKNHRAIKRNEDEMVKALMGKIDSKLLRSWEFFIMVIALVFALIPAIRGEMAWVYFLTFICLWQLIVFVARLLMFWYHDRVK